MIATLDAHSGTVSGFDPGDKILIIGTGGVYEGYITTEGCTAVDDPTSSGADSCPGYEVTSIWVDELKPIGVRCFLHLPMVNGTKFADLLVPCHVPPISYYRPRLVRRMGFHKSGYLPKRIRKIRKNK